MFLVWTNLCSELSFELSYIKGRKLSTINSSFPSFTPHPKKRGRLTSPRFAVKLASFTPLIAQVDSLLNQLRQFCNNLRPRWKDQDVNSSVPLRHFLEELVPPSLTELPVHLLYAWRCQKFVQLSLPPPPTEIRPVQVRQSHLLILILVALVSVLFDVEAKLELGNLRSGMESVVLMVLRFPREEAVDGCDMCVEPSGRLHGTDTAEPL